MNPVTLVQTDKEITVKGSGFTVVFDKVAGTFTSLEKNGVNMLLERWRSKIASLACTSQE